MDDVNFSYAAETDPAWKRALIHAIERATGQPRLKRLYLENRLNPRAGESFFAAAMRLLAIDVRYDAGSLARLPATGPLVVVANHPYGVLDGLAIGALIERVRGDFLILTNAVLLRAAEIRDYVLPVDFAETPEALETNLASRAAARAHLQKGGAIVVFPAGAVSTSPDRWGRAPAVDPRWPPFAAQLALRSRATVAPIWFDGQNSRIFQIASHFSLTLRLALLFHEVSRRIGSPLRVEIGEPLPFDRLASVGDRQELADRLRDVTYALAHAAG